jgi:hypothetical protein
MLPHGIIGPERGKAETYQSINQQIQSIVHQVGIEFLYVVLNKFYAELEFGI